MENKVLEFAKQLNQDPGLQKKMLDAAKALPEGLSDEEKVNRAVLPVAREAGFDFSYADCLALKEQLEAAENGEEILDDELRQTAGGAAWGVGIGGCRTALGVSIGVSYGDSGKWLACFVFGYANSEKVKALCLVRGID